MTTRRIDPAREPRLAAPHSHAARGCHRIAPQRRAALRLHSSLGVLIFAALLALVLLPALCAAERRAVVTIKADGSCTVRSDVTEPRSRYEQMIKSWDRMKNLEAAADGEDEPSKLAPVDPDAKPFTDEAMGKKLRALLEEDFERVQVPGEVKLESVNVTSNSARLVTMRSYSSLEELLQQPYRIWADSGLYFESIRADKDAASHLRLTLTPIPAGSRWTKSLRQTLKASRTAGELRFVLPGKVLASGLPNTESNATWIAFDGKQDETVNAALKLFEAPIVITAELAGLKLDAPLDSQVLMRPSSRRGGGNEPELPITDAGPGFVAEPMRVTVTTLHYFSEGQKHLKEARSAFGSQQTGMVVHAKLFAPKGRTLQSVTGVRVLKAVDDKGRPIAPEKDGEDAAKTMSHSLGGGRGNSTRIQLSLPLPPADAQSIEQLDGEAITITAGSWKEHTVPSVSTTTTNEIDLASVLPGAKLTFTKVTRKANQTTVEGEIKGPPGIRQIEIQGRIESNPASSIQANDRSFSTKDKVASRKFVLTAYHYGGGDDTAAGPLTIVARFPEDQKRERVKFTLKGLDLF